MSILAAYAVPHPPLIIPAVGRGEERGIASTVAACKEVARRIAAAEPDVIVVTSPHAPLYRDAFHVTSDAELDGSMRQFYAPRERVEARIDQELARAVSEGCTEAGIPVAGSTWRDREMDHATFIPLWFVDKAYRAAGKEPAYRVVRIGLSGLSFETHRQVGRIVARAVATLGRRAVFVASGDLSHKLKEDGPYGFAPEGPQFDARIAELFSTGELEGLFAFDERFCDRAAECGLRSFQIMAGALEEEALARGAAGSEGSVAAGTGRGGCADAEAAVGEGGVACAADAGANAPCGEGVFGHELLSCEGPFGVGYAVAAFERTADAGEHARDGASEGCAAESDAAERNVPKSGMAESAAEGGVVEGAAAEPAVDPYVALARASVEGFVRTGRPIKVPADTPCELLESRAGVFVSLHEDGELRGCIGTIEPVRKNVAEEIVRNGVAACSEDPRFPPVRAEELDYLELSVDVLFPAEPVASEAELDPARYGVIVSKGWRRGLLLPNLEGVDTVEQQVAIAKRKAGIGLGERGVRLERFEVVRHERGGEARRVR